MDPFYILCLTFLAISTLAAEELKMVHILYRHGDRTPVKSFPKDTNVWKLGPGQLTNIGKNQHYRLGKFFKQRYSDGMNLLSPTYNISQIVVRSTDVPRTLMSAECNLAGWYQPSDEEMFNKQLNWQPIPVHTRPEDEDYQLSMEVKCPKAESIVEKTLHSQKIIDEEKRNHKFYEYVSKNTGIPHEGIENIWWIYDTILCEKDHNKTVGKWVDKPWEGTTVFDKMRELDAMEFSIKYAAADLRKYRGGPLLKEIIGHMQDYEAGTLQESQRAFVYSAHDTTVSALLGAMNVFNGHLPPYAAAVMIELYEMDNQKLTVKVVYRNDSVVNILPDQLYNLTIKGCVDPCPLEKFSSLFKDILPDDWHKECQISSSIFNRTFYIIIGSVMGGVILIIVITLVLCSIRKKRQRYANYWGLTQEA